MKIARVRVSNVLDARPPYGFVRPQSETVSSSGSSSEDLLHVRLPHSGTRTSGDLLLVIGRRGVKRQRHHAQEGTNTFAGEVAVHSCERSAWRPTVVCLAAVVAAATAAAAIHTTFPVGVTVDGLAGSGLVLQDKRRNDLGVTTNGSSAFGTGSGPLAQTSNRDPRCATGNVFGKRLGAVLRACALASR
jgi:hypothetical protein